MDIGRLVVRRFWYAALALLLVSCGGGAGGDSGSSRPTLSASTTSLTFTATQGGAQPNAQTVALSASGGTVFVAQPVTSSSAFGASFNITGTTTGTITVMATPPTALAAGTYTGTITVTACGDNACATGNVVGSPLVINVTYTIQPPRGVQAAPQSLSFTQVQGGAAPATQTLGLSELDGSSYPWTASVIYQSGSGWLTLNGASSASGTSLPASLPVAVNSSSTLGTLNAIVRVTGNGNTLDVPVTYAVTEPPLTSSPSTLTFTAPSGGGLPATQPVTLSTVSGLPVGYATGVVYGAGATGWLSVVPSGTAPDTVNVGVNTTALAIGSYSGTLSFTTPGGQSTSVAVTYNVAAAALTFSQSSVSFTINTSSTASALSQTVNVGSTGGVLSWTASSNQPWVTVSPASGSSGSTVTLSLDPAQLDTLPASQWPASITFGYTSGNATTSALPVSLNLQIPKVTSVNPYVTTSATSRDVVLRGVGFSNPGLGDIKFGSTTVSSYTVLSDTELTVTHPSLTAGTYRVSFANQLGNPGIVRSTANLVVVDAPAFAAASIAYPNTTSKAPLNIVYDNERGALLVGVGYPVEGSSGDLFRYTFSGSAWSATSTAVSEFRDFAFALDGSRVIALRSRNVTEYDPATLAAGISTGDLGTLSNIAFFRRLALANNGNALITTGVNGSGFSQEYEYAVADTTRVPRLFPILAFLYFGTPGASADGSLIAIVSGSLSPAPSVAQYTGSGGAIFNTTATLNQSSTRPVLSRRATRVLLNGNLVYNSSFQLLGSIPASFAVALSPDGLKAYAYSGGTVLHTYDLNGTLANPSTDQFPEIGTGTTLAGDAGSNPVMTISADGGTLFIAGSNAIIVQPAP